MNKTFLCGSDNNLEDLLPWWYFNVKKHHPDIHVTVADFGLSQSGKHWAETHADKVLKYEKHPKLSWFYKPQAMLDTPYEYTCWLDIDCEVLCPVPEIFDFPTDERMAMTEDIIRMGYFADKPTGGAEHWWAAGVNVVKGKPQILKDWAFHAMNSDQRGDQEVLHQMININPKYNNMIVKMPLEYQWLRLSLHQDYDSPYKKIVHWTGPVGKKHIREKLMP